jgi:hypothetical protein
MESRTFSRESTKVYYTNGRQMYIHRRLASMSFVLVYIYWGSSVLGDVSNDVAARRSADI